MTDSTYKIIEIVGTSNDSLAAAIDNGAATAKESLSHLDWFEVVEIRGRIEDGGGTQFQVRMKVGFKIEGQA